jgi:hypothetical protein
VALRQETAFCVAMLAPGRSNFYAGGHSFRGRAIITTSWKGIAFAGELAQQPLVHRSS